MVSFADELKELALTAPKEKDTEDIFNEESNAKLVDFNDTYEEVDKRRGPEILTQSRYKGKNISRREMFVAEDEDYLLKLNPNLYEVVDDDDDDDDDNSEEDFEADRSAAQVDQGNQNSLVGKQSGVGGKKPDGGPEYESYSEEDFGDEESGEEAFDDEDADDQEDVDEEDEAFEETNGDVSTYTKANEKFDQFEDSLADKALAHVVSEEVRKGRCIANQMKIWDKLLEYRIQFQRVLALANQLPPCNVFKQTMKGFLSSPENARMYKQCVRNIEKAFEQLAEIRAELVRKYPEMKNSLSGKSATDSGDEEIASDDEEIPSDIASGYSEDEDGQPKQKKTKLDQGETDEELELNGNADERVKKQKKFVLSERAQADEEFHKKLIPFRNATIGKWYQRTKLASGKTSRGYTALEQPPVKQIEHILEDKDRLLQRTQIKRSHYKIIGFSETDKKDSEVAKQLIPEIFDDDDFYHHLLREVIERKTQDITDPLEISRHWIEIQKLRTKIKRKIDTKASKGRRIRYDVIPKLVSFMTAHDASTFSDQAKDELFSSIFGKQTTPKTDLEVKIPKNDPGGFRLFK